MRDVDATTETNLQLSRDLAEHKEKLKQLQSTGKREAEKRALRTEAALERERQKCKRIRLEKKSTYNLLR